MTERHIAQNQSDSAETSLTRRGFLTRAIGVIGAAVVVEACGATWLFLQPRHGEGSFGGVIDAGAADSFPNGSVTEYPSGRFYLARGTDGGFLAVYRRCPHLGCTIHWQAESDQFFCPCHASHFDALGQVENTPAPRALDLFAVRIRNGQVLVDTAAVQPRQVFERSQLTFVKQGD